jgi:hypothetical protein
MQQERNIIEAIGYSLCAFKLLECTEVLEKMGYENPKFDER